MSIPIIEIGKFNNLKILKETPQGIYLGDEIEEILLPNRYVPEQYNIGDHMDVFIYTDSEDRPVATTETPKILLGQFAYLRVKDVSSVGAFLDWGLEKDLLVPFKEQWERMKPDSYYMVYLYLDEVTDRLVASSHLNKFLKRDSIDIEEGEQVDLLIGSKTLLGYQAIINQQYEGLLYENEIFQEIKPGESRPGYVKKIREDRKIDLSLEPKSYISIEPNADKIFALLQQNDGFLPLNDKSSPEVIQKELKMSKKNFKKAVGSLYKKRLVVLEPKGIRLK